MAFMAQAVDCAVNPAAIRLGVVNLQTGSLPTETSRLISFRSLRQIGIQPLVAISPTNPLKIPPILFGRPPAIVTGNRPRDLHLELHRLSRLSPFFTLLVKLGRDGSRASVFREPAYRYDVLVRSQPDSK